MATRVCALNYTYYILYYITFVRVYKIYTNLIATCTVINVVYYFVSALVIQSVLPQWKWKCIGMRSDALEARDLLIPFDHCTSLGEKNPINFLISLVSLCLNAGA